MHDPRFQRLKNDRECAEKVTVRGMSARWRFEKNVRILRNGKTGWVEGVIVSSPKFKEFEWFTQKTSGIAGSLEKAKFAVYAAARQESNAR